MGRRWGRWGWQSSSIEQTTCLDEHSCSSSCRLVCWAVGRRRGLSGVLIAVSGVVVAVCVLDTALDAVLEVVVAGVTAVVGSDVAASLGGSGGGTGVNEASWWEQGGVGRLLDRRLELLGAQRCSVE